MGVSVEDIQEEFLDLDIEVTDQDVLLKLKEFCDRYNLDANKISCEYFAFYAKSGGREPNLDVLDEFERDKLRHLKGVTSRRPLDPIEGADNLPEPADNNTPQKLSVAAKRNVTPDTESNKKFVSAVGTPGIHSLNNSINTSELNTTQNTARYSDRKNRGDVMLQHNQEAAGNWSPSTNINLEITKHASTLDKPYRYMFDSLRERAAVLDEEICKVEDITIERLQINDLMDIRMTQVEPQIAVGRICCDSEGHLNSNSVILQASMDTSAGATIPLDLTNLESYSLFPGQVIAVEGTNPNGTRLQVTKMITEAPPPLAPAPVKDQVLDVLVSCGPYTPKGSDSYEPLLDVLDVIKNTQPHLAIFMGPFVDSENSGLDRLSESYQQYFERIVKQIFSEIEVLPTQVILIPSQRDLHENPVYPQPACNIGDPTIWEHKIHSFPDPCLINLNGVSIGVTSSDILFHLGKEEIQFPRRTGDRFSRLAEYVLCQRSFYPLYPANTDMNIDLEHLERHASLPVSPHLVITPSDLQYFVREVENSSTVLNPGRITKGYQGGTYAKLLIQCEEGKVSCKVDIKKI